MYKPLPDSLTIKTSKVDGLGLFAKEGIGQGTNLGMSHIEIGDKMIRTPRLGIIRTPLGGFINHSGNANCVKVELRMTNQDKPDLKFNYKKWNLVTLRDIKEGEELTVRYTFYDIKKKEIKTPSEKSQDELEPIGNINAPMMELE